MNANAEKDTGINVILNETMEQDVPDEVKARLQKRLTAFRERLEETKPTMSLWDRFMASPRWAKAIPISIPAAVVLILVILVCLVVFGPATKSVYAQAMATLEKARTVHVVGEQVRDGKTEQRTELWYDKGQGIRISFWRAGQKITELLDTASGSWRHTTDSGIVIQSSPKDFSQNAILKKIINIPNKLPRASFSRDSTRDQIIDGDPCESYVFLYPNSHTARAFFWVDPQERIRLWEDQRLEDGEWQTRELIRIAYELPVEAAHFSPKIFGDTEIVNIKNLFDRYFSLKDAAFKKEVLNALVYAVHDVKRLDHGRICVLSSLRPTDSTRRKITHRSGPAAWNFGCMNLLPVSQRINGMPTTYTCLIAAEIYDDGFQATWHILSPRGPLPSDDTQWSFDDNQCSLRVSISAIGKLVSFLKKANLPTREKLELALTLPKDGVDLEVAANEIHATAQALEPFVAIAQLFTGSEDFVDAKGQRCVIARSSKPSDLPKATYAKKIEEQLEPHTLESSSKEH